MFFCLFVLFKHYYMSNREIGIFHCRSFHGTVFRSIIVNAMVHSNIIVVEDQYV